MTEYNMGADGADQRFSGAHPLHFWENTLNPIIKTLLYLEPKRR